MHIERIILTTLLFVITTIIDKIVTTSERIFDVIIDTNVSPTTCFSISLLLSSFPTNIAAKPSNGVQGVQTRLKRKDRFESK